MNKSTKKIIDLKDIIAEKLFKLPKSMANEIDIVTGEPCIFVMVNGVKYYIPVEKPTPIPYIAFCVLKDKGIADYYLSYDEGEDIKSI